MLNRIRHEERGVAMVVSLMVAFVVLLLSTVVVSQAIHSSDQSGYDRERLQSVNTAEAGLDYYFNYLASTGAPSLSTSPVTITTGVGPGTGTVTITPTFYQDPVGTPAGTIAFSGTPSSSNYPTSVKVKAVGTTNGTTPRTMESFIVLHPVFGGLTGAIVSNDSMTDTNNITINGNNGNDADIYVLNGNFSAPSGVEAVKGSIYVTNGYVSIGTNVHVYGSVWAGGAYPNPGGYVSVNHPNAQIDGDVKSTNDVITVSNGAVNPGGASYCRTPLTVAAKIAGPKVQTCSLGAPPTQAFPQLKYNQTDWQNASPAYTNFQTFTGATACTDARNYIEGTGANTYNGGSVGNTVVRITQSCSFTTSNNATISLGANLAIVTDGAIDLSQHSTWNGVTSTRNLFLVAPWPASGSPVCTGGVHDVTVSNNTDFNTLVQTSVYSACAVNIANNNNFAGQVIGSPVNINNNFTMTYRPITIPGANVTGFTQDIAYIREVK